jgi:hypothetical protein
VHCTNSIEIIPTQRAQRIGIEDFPRFFKSRGSIANRSIALQTASIVLVICLSGLQDLLSYLSLTLSVSSAATVGTLLLKSSRISLPRTGLSPPFFVIASISIAIVSAWHQPLQAAFALGTLLVGVVGYAIATKQSPLASRNDRTV